MGEFWHGGDVITAEEIYGGGIVDFSANFNPLGMPPEVRKAAEEAVAESVHYPDPFCRELVFGLAEREGVNREYILCGNGAADLIFRLVYAKRPRLAVVMAPTFAEYAQALEMAGCEVLHHRLKEAKGFELTDEILDYLTYETDMLFLCNPNNPTGRPVPPKLMDQVVKICRERKISLVVDECFVELADGPRSLTPRVPNNPHLFLLKAFTKSYCMAGLRLGYCVTADEDLLDRMRLCGQPWSVSHPAQRAGIAALQLSEYPERARAIIREERGWLEGELQNLGVTVFPSCTNYIMFRAANIYDLRERMTGKGILIRSCANFLGLGDDYYRVAVKLRDENERLIRVMKEVF